MKSLFIIIIITVASIFLSNCDYRVDLYGLNWGHTRIILKEQIVLKENSHKYEYFIEDRIGSNRLKISLFYPDYKFQDLKSRALKKDIINSLKGLEVRFTCIQTDSVIFEYKINPGKKGFKYFFIDDVNPPSLSLRTNILILPNVKYRLVLIMPAISEKYRHVKSPYLVVGMGRRVYP